MRKIFQKLFPISKKAELLQKGKARKSSGQSLVEIAIALPVLIILFTGMLEFGFMLNFYLSLLDATREAARFASGTDPFVTNPATGVKTDDPNFYSTSASLVRGALDPKIVDPSYKGRRLILDSTVDDVIVTVFCVNGGTAYSYPKSGAYHLYNNVPSDFSITRIQDTYVNDAPNAGLVVVEVRYHYRPVVGVFYNGLIGLRAHTIMPLNAADPSPTCP